MDGILARLFFLPRSQKQVIQLLADAVLIFASFVGAMALRLETFAFMANSAVWLAIFPVIPISLFIFARLGFYRAVIRYIAGKALGAILIGVFASAVALFVITQVFALPVPRSVPMIYLLLAFLLISGVRYVLRSLFMHRQTRQKARVIIYGAGSSGRQVLSALQQGSDYAPIAFVDDARALQGGDVGGCRVHAPADLADLVSSYGAKAVLLAVPSASRAERRVILERLEPLPVHVQTIPGMADLVSGRAQINEFNEVAVEDLLGRDPVPPRENLMGADIRGKVVMVTGAGGSIGSELCRQILEREPKMLVLFEISEAALYSIDIELKARAEAGTTRIVPLLGSVQDPRRVAAALQRFGVQTLYHAAAYKHVPLVEENVIEGLRNNVFGTKMLARAAVSAGVEAFILISTDKAVRPANIMGASKRMAELICQSFAARQTGTRFTMVRFGNVLGSSGSVIPRFRAQIAAGGPLTVTHPEITRYFMTIPEAAQLVIQAGAMARGGDVFVLDMGESVRITDLAARMIRLCGLVPYVLDADCDIDGVPDRQGDIAIRFSGLRHGEKLYEELLIGNDTAPTDHPRILTANEANLAWPELSKLLDRLFDACVAYDIKAVRAILEAAPTGYVPSDTIADLTWNEGPTGDMFLVAGPGLPNNYSRDIDTHLSAAAS